MWVSRVCKLFAQNLGTSYNSTKCIENSTFLSAFTLQLEQIRWRKRNLKKPLSKQQRLERRLKREEKEAKRKQFSFMQRIFNKKMSQLYVLFIIFGLFFLKTFTITTISRSL